MRLANQHYYIIGGFYCKLKRLLSTCIAGGFFKDCLTRKTRQALEIAYAGFDNALESDLIDSYIYEINALQKRYQHLTELAALQPADREKNLYQHSPIRALVSHVFG